MYFPIALFLLHLDYEVNLYETYETMIYHKNEVVFCTSDLNKMLQYMDFVFGWNKMHVTSLFKTPPTTK